MQSAAHMGNYFGGLLQSGEIPKDPYTSSVR